jgi:hypothetical protein
VVGVSVDTADVPAWCGAMVDRMRQNLGDGDAGMRDGPMMDR